MKKFMINMCIYTKLFHFISIVMLCLWFVFYDLQRCIVVVAKDRIELSTRGSSGHCSTTELLRHLFLIMHCYTEFVKREYNLVNAGIISSLSSL